MYTDDLINFALSEQGNKCLTDDLIDLALRDAERNLSNHLQIQSRSLCADWY